MDRQIVYPAQIPLDSDLLNAQRNAFVGLGHLAGMAYGDSTVAAGGFACTPGTGLAVTISPGSLLAAGVVDVTAYGTLAANGSMLVRQYISRDPVTLTVPGAGATYTVYATPATVDADATVLPFYNAADPSVTYAGADNSGKAAPTVRQDVAQLGIAATVPEGAYPLWTITVPAAATAMTADMIAQAEGAPFYETIPELQASKISKSGDGMTGPLTVLDATEDQNPVALGQVQSVIAALVNAVAITSSQTFTLDPKTKWVRIRVVGGGGGGGGCGATSNGQQATSQGGACGAYLDVYIKASDLLALMPAGAGSVSLDITIGAAGIAGTVSGAAGAGGASIIAVNGTTIISCPGGSFGFHGSSAVAGATFPNANDTVLPTCTVGNVVTATPGMRNGSPNITSTAYVNGSNGGDGGSTPLGSGGNGGQGGGITGIGATGYGGGGGGNSQSQNYAGCPGGAGYQGAVIIEEFA